MPRSFLIKKKNKPRSLALYDDDRKSFPVAKGIDNGPCGEDSPGQLSEDSGIEEMLDAAQSPPPTSAQSPGCTSPQDEDTLPWSSPGSSATPPPEADEAKTLVDNDDSPARPLPSSPSSHGGKLHLEGPLPMTYHLPPVSQSSRICRPIRPEPERPRARYHPYAALMAAQNPSPALERLMYRLLPRTLPEPSHLQLKPHDLTAAKDATSPGQAHRQIGPASGYDAGGADLSDDDASPEKGKEALKAFSSALKQHRLGLPHNENPQRGQARSSSIKHRLTLPGSDARSHSRTCGDAYTMFPSATPISPSQLHHQRSMYADAMAASHNHLQHDVTRPRPRPRVLSEIPHSNNTMRSPMAPNLPFSLPPVSYYKTPASPPETTDRAKHTAQDPVTLEDLSSKPKEKVKYTDKKSDTPLKVIQNLDTKVDDSHNKALADSSAPNAHAPISPGNENRPARPVHPKMALLDRYRQGELHKVPEDLAHGPPRGVPLQDPSRHQTALYRVDITRLPRATPEASSEEPDMLPRGDPPRFRCSDCNKTYATYSGLTKHRQFHCTSHVKKEFVCKYCNKLYLSIGALKMHIRTHTLPCKCPLCGKAFSRPWLLQGHIRTHTGEKPFECQHCARAFADRSNLRAHLQTHAEIKKYCCKTCCRTFSRMSLLVKHEDSGCAAVLV